jgi:hypothetical protein
MNPKEEIERIFTLLRREADTVEHGMDGICYGLVWEFGGTALG